MPVNPFQATAEMQWGGYESKKSYRGQGQMGAGSLAGQGHSSRANMVAPTEGQLQPTPKASGQMPQGNANIGRANYGQQQTEQPQRQGRTASFGGMGAGATKGGGGPTAGGNMSFDLSIGKTDFGSADLRGARMGAVGMGANTSDSNFGDVDQSQTFAPTITGSRGGSPSSRASNKTTVGGSPAKSPAKRTPAAPKGEGTKKGTKAPAAKAPAAKAPTAKAPAAGGGKTDVRNTANVGRGGDVTGDMKVGNMAPKFGSPTLQIGRNKIGRDTFTDNRNSKNTVSNDNRKAAPKSEPAAKEKAKPKSEEKAKAEATKKTAIKEKAKSDVEKAVKTPPSPKKPAKKATKKEDEE